MECRLGDGKALSLFVLEEAESQSLSLGGPSAHPPAEAHPSLARRFVCVAQFGAAAFIALSSAGYERVQDALPLVSSGATTVGDG